MNETEEFHLPQADPADGSDPRLLEALRQYQAALETGAKPNRRAFLAQHTEVAAELAECLDGLDFLHSAVPQVQAPDRGLVVGPALQPDGMLGDFRIIREIGRGGMGVVYEAHQVSLDRRVALKVLPFAATLDDRQLRRFENEARAAAQLHHGNIVPVYAVGKERGTHFYAMQLIDGRTLAAVIDELRQTPLTKAPAHPAGDTMKGAASITYHSVESKQFFRSVANIGTQAADALDYAHQMGVVHRDVKPANLLLDGRGNLWVTDFGLARFQAAPGMTASGDLVGTLRYMSPEQAAGKPIIDPRSDIYSLGVTLYELLTRQAASPGNDRQACLRQILEDEPIAPRKLNAALPVELETIVLKAMAKGPEERYGTARELADDLRRYLDDQPVQARRPTVRDRVAKWARRHRRFVAAAVLAVIASAVLLAATSMRVAQADQEALEKVQREQARTQTAFDQLKIEQQKLTEEQGRTQVALLHEAEQRTKAVRNYEQAREVLDYLTYLGTEGLANKPEFKAVRQEILRKLEKYFEQFIAEHSDDPMIHDELVEAQSSVARIYAEKGEPEKVVAMLGGDAPGAPRMRNFGGPPGTPPPFFHLPRTISPVFLVGQHSVQEDLQWPPEKAHKMWNLMGSKDQRGGPPKREEVQALEKEIREQLQPEEYRRLQQIAWQLSGALALNEPAVSESLHLSAQQKKDIHVQLFGKDGRGPGRSSDKKGGPGPGFDGEWKAAHEAAFNVLSADQKEQWKVLVGRPFVGEMHWGFPPGRGSSRDRGSRP